MPRRLNPLSLFPPRATGRGTGAMPPPVPPILPGPVGVPTVPGGILPGKPEPPPPEMQMERAVTEPQNVMNAAQMPLAATEPDPFDGVDSDAFIAAFVKRLLSGAIDRSHLQTVINMLAQIGAPENTIAPQAAPPPPAMMGAPTT